MTNDSPTKLDRTFIEEIKTIFLKIDDNIISLLKCSSEDFTRLNEHFKQSFKDARSISENTDSILKSITDTANSFDFINEISTVSLQWQNLYTSLDESTNAIYNHVEKCYRTLEMVFLPANNFHQNVMTLKLLMAKMNIDYLYTDKSDKDKNTTNINVIVEKIKIAYTEFSAVLKDSKNYLEETVLILDKEMIVMSKDNRDMVQNLAYTHDMLTMKYKEAGINMLELNNITRDYSDSSTKIITNLQYDDIIRQKVEHVQKIHKEVVNELTMINFDNGLTPENTFDYLIKIRNIASLQASQLIHANKEYQRAIEVISVKLLGLIDSMGSVAELSNEFAGNYADHHTTHLTQVKDKLNKLNFSLFVSTINNEVKNRIVQLKERFNKLIKSYKEIHKLSQQLNEVIQFLAISTQKTSSKELSHDYNQLKQLAEDIHFFRQKMYEGLSQLDVQFKDLLHNVGQFDSKKEKSDKLSSDKRNIIANIDKEDGKLKLLLENNISISDKIISELKKSVEDIKYYGFFEKIIEEIITDFNSIKDKLDSIGEIKDLIDNQEIVSAKTHYTMQSEYAIHEIVSRGNADKISDLDTSQFMPDNDDDNLELF